MPPACDSLYPQDSGSYVMSMLQNMHSALLLCLPTNHVQVLMSFNAGGGNLAANLVAQLAVILHVLASYQVGAAARHSTATICKTAACGLNV